MVVLVHRLVRMYGVVRIILDGFYRVLIVRRQRNLLRHRVSMVGLLEVTRGTGVAGC